MASSSSSTSINEALKDDGLRSILGKLDDDKNKEIFGLVQQMAEIAEHRKEETCCTSWPSHASKDGRQILWAARTGPLPVGLQVILPGRHRLRSRRYRRRLQVPPTPQFAQLQRKLTNKGLTAVAEGCPNLKSLHLAGCRFVTDGILKSLSTNCANLEELGLQGCSNITDSGLEDLVAGCHRIQFLDINKCSNVGDSGISNVSKACSASLKTLKLLDCYKIGDESIFSLARHCVNLETLIIGGCRDISNESMKSLANSCGRSLRNLRMDWCLNLSDSSLGCILAECRKLEALDIGCCKEITDATFEGFGTGEENGMRLKVLKVSNCPKITVSGISMVLGKCRSLEYLDVRSCPFVTKLGCDEAGLQFPEYCKVNFNGSLNEPGVLV